MQKLKYSEIINYVAILVLAVSIVGCKNAIVDSGAEKTIKTSQLFKSDFNSSKERTFIGPEYWSNPMQDWQVRNGELECLVSNKNRNVHLLTKKLDSIDGDMQMNVSLKLLNIGEDSQLKNWVGFSIGSQGKFDDFRSDAVFGKGLNVGVTTNGNLFIDEISEDKVNKEIQSHLQEGVDLKSSLNLKEDGYELTISLVVSASKKVIGRLSKSKIPLGTMVGDLVLVSHFNVKKNDPKSTKKSVSFKNWEVSGSKIVSHNAYKFGPILFSQYTLSKETVKLTAQMAPVILSGQKVQLQIKENNHWKTIQEAAIDKDARTATFKLVKWKTKSDIPYRLAYKMDRGNSKKEEFYWKGTIRKDPIDQEEVVVAGFTGNADLGFPNSDIFNQVKYQNPDVLFFSGDQIYESTAGYGTQRAPHDKATLDYLRKWYLYGWAYRDLLKNRPTVAITDDHDVYHGNIWGEGGENSPTQFFRGSKGQDAGGYMMPARWVKMVERTQTSHLPDAFDPSPVSQGIGTYYTDMVYGGISFAILEDRKFKSAPIRHLPEANIKNGWVQNKSFDMSKEGDRPNANLLGDRQLLFLNQWATDWSHQAQMKMLLSQTIFANVATLPEEAMSGAIISKLRIMNKGEYPPNDRPVADLDSNGWPQSGRNKAVETIRKGFAFHLAGDQHLGSTVQYGVDEWNDSGYALCVPSISNYWPRRWYPSEEGKNRNTEKPRYTGEYKDGFGNKMTVHAISNPLFTGKEPSRLYDRATGYGIVRLNKNKRTLELECWPRHAKPWLGDNIQYEGWPIRITQESNYGRKAMAYLPEISIEGIKNPVVEIINGDTEKVIYSLRINTSSFIPKIFDKSIKYIVRVGEPDTNNWKVIRGVHPKDEKLEFKF